jgi:hypothetical protein
MKYFKIEEFRCKDGSVMPEEAKENLTALVEKVLDPARERYGAAIHVNSGYRTEAYNKKVGGVKGSQHCCKNGSAAADVCAVHEGFGCMADWKAANQKIAKAIVEGGQWDQMILYPTFVHVSWKRNGFNRKQVLRKTATGYSDVSAKDVLTL